MALKAGESFIRFVSMGAVGAHRAADILRSYGHDPRELERYATCNKIWQTKIKRLRMPDLFCVRCGRRFEVRAKTKLEIKVSDSPTVEGRAWDSGLRDSDTIIFIRCQDNDGIPEPAATAEAFEVQSLRAAIASSRLGPPKSAGEGAERDRVWPSIVPSRSGSVVSVDTERIGVELEGGRRQSYRLHRANCTLIPYVRSGDEFTGGERIIAGTPGRKASLQCSGDQWDPEADLASPEAMSRFAAIKAAGLRGDIGMAAALRQITNEDSDARIRLEAIGALVRLGDAGAIQDLFAAFESPVSSDLQMEAVLIAGEILGSSTEEVLQRMLVAQPCLEREELRAAVIWSLGVYGHGDHDTVSGYLGDASDLVAAHAVIGLGSDLPDGTRERLIALLPAGGRVAAGASWVLSHDSPRVVERLIAIADGDGAGRAWAVAILGQRPREELLPYLEARPELRQQLDPLWKMSETLNWTRTPDGMEHIDSIRKQTVRQSV